VQASAYLPELHSFGVLAWTASSFIFLCGVGLLIGFLTRVLGWFAVLGSVALTFTLLPAPAYSLFSNNPLSFDVIIMATATSLLGPGAYSLDAHWFGRRKIIIPKSSNASSSSGYIVANAASRPPKAQ
jgi:uncharacterized membrane protein YphA (DoxX/SURF4 family)